MEKQPTQRRVPPGLLTLFLAMLPAAVGCAKMGEPLPPTVVLPDTIRDLEVAQVGRDIQLTFGLPAEDVEWVEIYRQCDPRTPLDRIELIARLGAAELFQSRLHPGRFDYRDRHPERTDCRYALRFVDVRNRRSQFSNFAQLSDSTGGTPPGGGFASGVSEYYPRPGTPARVKPIWVGRP